MPKPESKGFAGIQLTVRLRIILMSLLPFESIYNPASEYAGVFEVIFYLTGMTCFFYNDLILLGKILFSLLIQGINIENIRSKLLT